MELRYLGFDQSQNSRAYRYNVLVSGDPARQYTVTVDLALFLSQHVGIQEGPTLCARKLAADLEKSTEGSHELTIDDLRAYADARAADEARRADSRKGVSRRPKTTTTDSQSPWRRSRA